MIILEVKMSRGIFCLAETEMLSKCLSFKYVVLYKRWCLSRANVFLPCLFFPPSFSSLLPFTFLPPFLPHTQPFLGQVFSSSQHSCILIFSRKDEQSPCSLSSWGTLRKCWDWRLSLFLVSCFPDTPIAQEEGSSIPSTSGLNTRV